MTNNLTSTRQLLLQKILFTNEYFVIRVLIILNTFSSFILINKDTFLISCTLSLIQNLIFPFLIAYLLVSKAQFLTARQKLLIGTSSGAIVGAIPAIIFLVISNINYYFFGGRNVMNSINNQLSPSLSPSLIQVGLWSQIFLLIFLISISTIMGMLGGMFGIQFQNRKQ